MKTNLFVRVAALGVALVLLLAGCSSASSGGSDGKEPSEEEAGRRVVPFSQMAYARPDAPGLAARLEELAGAVEKAESFDAAMKAVDESDRLMEDFDTQWVLAKINHYLNKDDETLAGEVAFFEEQQPVIQAKAGRVTSILLEGSFAGEYRGRFGEYVFDTRRAQLIFASEGLIPYYQQRQGLVSRYREMLATLTVENEGTTYRWAEIEQVESTNLRRQLADSYYALYLTDYVNLYAQLVELDRTTAYNLGFDSAEDMFYVGYGRRYSPGELRASLMVVKEQLAPVAAALLLAPDEASYKTPESIMAALPGALAAVDQALAEGVDGMTANALFSVVEGDGLYARGETLRLPAYDAPYLYQHWDGDTASMNGLLGQAGVFSYYWQHYRPLVQPSADALEFFAAGLPLLLKDGFAAFSDNAQQAAAASQRSSLLDGLVTPALLEEFQLAVYQLDSFDGAILGSLYTRLLQEYGYGGTIVGDLYGADNSWIADERLFAAPFYTASSVMGTLGAMQLLGPGATPAETYKAALQQNPNQHYIALLESAGLRPPFEPSIPEGIAVYYYETFGLEIPSELPATEPDASAEGDGSLPEADSSVPMG